MLAKRTEKRECAANDAIEPRSGAKDDRVQPPLEDGAAMLKAAKIVCAGEDQFCLIRKVGSGWLIAQTHAEVVPGDLVQVVLADDISVEGIASRAGAARVCITFGENINLDALLAKSRRVRNGRKPRMPRVRIEAFARLRVGARLFSVVLKDISQGGAKICVHGLLSGGDEAVLTVPGLPPVAGVIRWCCETKAGVSFNRPLGFAELTSWLRAYRKTAAPDGIPDGMRRTTLAGQNGAAALHRVERA